MVVDDEPDLRFLAKRILTRAGHQVIAAGNGADALEAVRQVRPDLVVTDMMMPVMNGVELIRRLRADPVTAGIPILAASSDWHLAVEADAALAKPYGRADLVEAAERLLREGSDRR
ncbi:MULTISPECIES: response regulator [unclassified Actinoplanes]|uniref:response regulator n=1 Tax=unclassified Actinoplanes TaxID=2626549 RepID=UPI001E4A13CC|nr:MULTISPECIES: response regulator [unclassified Actinoplanes]